MTSRREDDPLGGVDVKDAPNASTASGIFNIVNTIIGGGALALPFVMRQSGVGGGLILTLLVCVLSLYSQRLIVLTSQQVFGGAASFSKLGNKAFGPKGHIYTEVSVILFLLGAEVGYMIIIGSLLTPLIHEIGLTELSFEVVTAIIAVVIVLPLSSLRHMDSLRYTSFVALFFIACLGVGVTVKATKRLNQYGVDPALTWWGNGFSGYFVSLPIVNFAFTFHPSIPPVWVELRDQSEKNINFISLVSVIGCAVFYAGLGLFGYLYHYEETPDNILLAYPDDVLFIGLKLGYALVIIFSYPVVNYATRAGIDGILFKSQPAPMKRLIIESFFIVAVTYGIAMGIPSIDVVFGLIGSTVGQLVIFINPALFYLILHRDEEIEIVADRGGYEAVEPHTQERTRINWRDLLSPRKIPALLLVIFGLVCGVVSVTEISRSIDKLINEVPS